MKRTLLFAAIGCVAACALCPAISASAEDFSLFQHRDDPVISAPADAAYQRPFSLTPIDGQYYCIDANGVKCIGEQTIGGVPYLFAPNGVMMTGWQDVAGARRYYDPQTSNSLTGVIKWRDELYYVSKNVGKICGYYEENGIAYYADEYGVLVHDGFFTMENGTRAYANANGALANGEVIDVDGTRYFCEKGIPTAGFHTQNGITRYYQPDTLTDVLGFVDIDNNRYYFDAQNGMLKGLQNIGGEHYFFDENGVMQTGMVWVGNKLCYFLRGSGVCVNGLLTFGDYSIYFKGTEGAQQGVVSYQNTLLVFGKDFHLAHGMVECMDGTRISDAEGHPLKGWQNYDGKSYYIYEDSYLVAKSTTIDGFTIGADGAAHSALYLKAEQTIANTTHNPDALYSFVTRNYRYKKIENTRTRDQLNQAGWDTLVAYTIEKRAGVCYYLAATLDYFMQMCGYKTRLVHATHSTGDHYWNQIYVNGQWLNYDPTYSNRGNITWDNIIARGSYSVYGFLTINYDLRGAYVNTSFEAYT